MMRRFMPQSRAGWTVTACLCALIIGAGGVVGAKYGHNVFVSGQMAWESVVALNPYAPVDKAGLARYAESHKPQPKWVEEEGASYTYKFDPRKYMADGSWCLQSGEAQTGNVAACTLAVMNLDDLLLDNIETSNVQVSASAFGCSATIAEVFFGESFKGTSNPSPPTGWPAAAADEWDDFCDLVPENAWCRGHLFAATASGDTSAVTYRVFGYYALEVPGDPPGEPTWVGDTEWTGLTATFAIQNVKMMARTSTASSSTRTIPRYPTDVSSNYEWQNGENCTSSVTFGGNTVTVAQTEEAATWLATFAVAINYAKAPTANLSYAEVQGITIGDEVAVPINTASFYSPNGEWWVATHEEPENAHWHFFGGTGGFQLHRLPDTSTLEDCQAWSTTTIRGPVRFNVAAGAMWPDAEGTGLPAGFQVRDCLVQWVSETETEQVMLGPGLSDYYVMAIWSAQGDGTYVFNRTGTYDFHQCTPVVDPDWLTANGLDLGNGTDGNDNAHPIIALHSLEDILDSEDPYWGPAVTYEHTDISVDIPPNEVDRPTAWVGSGGVTCGVDSGEWTVAAPITTPTVTRTLASRYPIKMGILAAWNAAYEGRPYGPQASDDGQDWIICMSANRDLSATLAAWPELAAVTAEDVTNWDNSAYLRMTFTSLPAGAKEQQFSLTLGYDIYDPTDPCYNCFTHRFGSEGEFDYEVTSGTVTLYGIADADTGEVVFDLGLFPRNATTHLQHVTSVAIGLPAVAGVYELDDLRLVKDWRDYDEGEGVSIPLDIEPQQSPMPWKFKRDFTGFGSTINGMNHLDIPYGYEQFDGPGSVQRGMKGQQYAQYCPDMEDPPSIDPTTAKSLVRLVGELQYQEQLTTCTYETATVEAATVDADDNTLFGLYWWDLHRVRNADGKAAIHCGTTYLSSIPYRPRTVTIEWSAYGCGHGIVANGLGTAAAVRVRGSGAYSTNYDTYDWKFFRKLKATPEAEWSGCGSFQPDLNGRFITPPALEQHLAAPPVGDEEQEADPTDGYLYAIRAPGATAFVQFPTFDTREFALAYVPGQVTLGDPFLRRDHGLIWLACVDDLGIAVACKDARDALVWLPCDTRPFTGAYERPSIAIQQDGSLWACATNSGTRSMEIKFSRDNGKTWSVPA